MLTEPRPVAAPDRSRTSSDGDIALSAPRIEHHVHALGIGEARPRISWTIDHAPTDWGTSDYQLRVRADGRADETSDWLAGAGQSLVAWPFGALRSRERVHIAVRVRAADGTVSAWSPATAAEIGLLEATDWVARPITPLEPPEDCELRRPPLMRHEFDLRGRPVSARLYLTAHGLVEPYLNGIRVGDEDLAPGWTVYPHRLRYSTYDVTDLLQAGPNALGAFLGDGWYRGRLGFDGGNRDIYGDRLALLAQLEVELADGTRQVVATGPSWRAGLGPVLSSGLYEGERYDARLLEPGWSSAGFDDADWSSVEVVHRDPATLVAPEGPPIRCTEEVAPASISPTDRGTTLLDFGQNLVGRLRIRVDGPEGTVVRLRHAEVLQDGHVYVRPLRGAQSVDEYVLGTAGEQEWEPRFTIHGFRYVEVEGWPGRLRPGDVVARVLHTDMRRTGGFSSSDTRLNRLHANVVWSMRGNFVGLPTDCPQRDERLGWTGDIQVFGPTGTFLYDSAGLLSSWLRDLALEQLPDGTVPWFVPAIYGNPMWSPPRPGAAWGDAAVIVPWTLYERYGDLDVLARQYDSARAWVDCVERLAGPERLWNTGFQLGDWLDPAAPPDDPADARTDRYLVATAYFARSSSLLARMAEVVGRPQDADRYGALATEVREAFVRRYVMPAGRLTSDAPTAYALALAFDLLPPDLRDAAGERLATLIQDGGDVVGTGFVGTPVVLDALSSTGHLDRAYALLMQTACPSWLYMVGQGATTMWERWDSILPDGTVNPGDMTSFNHYALGSVADWLHGTVAGLRQSSPAGDVFDIAPRPGGGLSWAQAWLQTAFGRAEVTWKVDGGTVAITATVPIGARARVDLGSAGIVDLTAGHHELSTALDHVTAT
ncbi:alpha-L-rhamnosidase [Cellulomonas sp. URHD0024]|uniref:alpha-L-rhamnosidase n=1 Tax=Cellulomonas sp. URHD0024 TaxID=1302620 RepID=UPI00041A44C3|nr:alpha-L-rhamnosidase [Cellulomonas sp. URHD0024]